MKRYELTSSPYSDYRESKNGEWVRRNELIALIQNKVKYLHYIDTVERKHNDNIVQINALLDLLRDIGASPDELLAISDDIKSP